MWFISLVNKRCILPCEFGGLYPPQPPRIDGAVVAQTVAHSSRQQLSGERGARMKSGPGETRVISITLCRPVTPQTHHRVSRCCTAMDDPKIKKNMDRNKHLRTVAAGERDWLPMEECAETVSFFSFSWYQDTSWMYAEEMWILGDWIFWWAPEFKLD